MTEKEKHSIPVDLISRFLSGQASTDELIDLERWKAASEENRRTFEQYRRIWESTGELTIFTDIDIEIDQELGTLLYPDEDEQVREAEKAPLRFLPLFLRVAALVLTGLLIGYSGVFIYRSLNYDKISAMSGNMLVALPDGSMVSLKKGSVMEFPRKFLNGQREVRLNGEAFFNVHRDISQPFSVISGKFRLQVLGTSFNIAAWKDKDLVKVAVKKGEVEIFPANKEEHRKIVPAGHEGIYSRKSKQVFMVESKNSE